MNREGEPEPHHPLRRYWQLMADGEEIATFLWGVTTAKVPMLH